MDSLQAGVERTFSVFPESSTFFQPCEGPLDDPSLGHDGEGVELVAFRDLHRPPLGKLTQQQLPLATALEQVQHTAQCLVPIDRRRLGALATPSNKGRTRATCSRLTSLPYTFFPIHIVSSQSHRPASN